MRVHKFFALTRKFFLLRRKSRCVIEEKPLPVDQIKMLFRFFRRQPLRHHFRIHAACNTATGRTCTEAHIHLIDQLFFRNFQTAQNAGQGDDPRPLYIIVKYGINLIVLLKQSGCMISAEIFKVQVQFREEFFYRFYKRLEEVVIFFSRHPFMTITQV